LAIVRQIEAILPDHHLRWRSRVGSGSCFALELPVAAPACSETLATADAVNVECMNMLAGRYVLVVDDEPEILNGMLLALQAVGCVAEGAETCAATRRLLDDRDRCPDLLITDYRLEDGVTGRDVVELLRTRFEWAGGIPVLFVTGELMPAAVLNGFHGCYDVYPKPVTHAELLARAARLLSVPHETIRDVVADGGAMEGVAAEAATYPRAGIDRH
jgi:CheY-like chemotaxis protein